MTRRWTKIGVGGAIVAITGAAIIIYARPNRDHTSEDPAAQPVPVIAVLVERHDVPIVLTGLGTVTALNTAIVRSQVNGLLTSVNFQEGQSVKKGDVLAQIDPRTFQAQVDQAEAALARDQSHPHNAQLNLQRIEPLAGKGFATEEALENQQSSVA